MKLFSYLLLLPLSIFSGTLDFDEWKLEKSSDNINIYTRNVEGHSLKEFKATTVFKNVTMEEVLKEIYEAPSYYKNPEFGVSYFVEELSFQRERFYYYSESLPWPVKNRDAVTKLCAVQETQDKIVLVIKATPNSLPKKSSTIRIQELDGSWVLEKHPSGIKATQQIYMDPGGMVPSFITNSLIVRGPLKTFSALRKTLQQ